MNNKNNNSCIQVIKNILNFNNNNNKHLQIILTKKINKKKTKIYKIVKMNKIQLKNNIIKMGLKRSIYQRNKKNH